MARPLASSLTLGLSNQFLTTWFAGGVIHYFAGQPLEYYLVIPTPPGLDVAEQR